MGHDPRVKVAILTGIVMRSSSRIAMMDQSKTYFKDGPRLNLCATWPRRPAGYNKNIPVPHIKAVPELL